MADLSPWAPASVPASECQFSASLKVSGSPAPDATWRTSCRARRPFRVLRQYLEPSSTPDPDALALAKAIAHALYTAHEGEQTPVAIVVDPATRDVLERAYLGCWHTGRHSLFSLPVEIDPGVEGWRVKMR